MFIVAWHEENATGVPQHVMGAELFTSKKKALKWIEGCIEEDRERAREADDSFFVFRRSDRLSDVHVKTCTDIQTTYYEVVRRTRHEKDPA